MKFAHLADVHLGYNQYGIAERFNDFGRAWIWACLSICDDEVDFVLLAGDLFHNRNLDAEEMSQAITGLQYLADEGIKVFAVEGNHEQKRTSQRQGWLKFLEEMNLLMVVNSLEGQAFELFTTYIDKYGGSGDVLIYGIPWMGAATDTKAIEVLELAKKTKSPTDKLFKILMLHCGWTDGEKFVGSIDKEVLEELEEEFDYIALGHTHEPLSNGTTFNPGSLENNSLVEARWEPRGYYLVNVDFNEPTEFTWSTIPYPHRRPFIHFEVAGEQSLKTTIDFLVSYKERDNTDAPILHITLTTSDLDPKYVKDYLYEEAEEKEVSPLKIIVHNKAVHEHIPMIVDVGYTNKTQIEHAAIKKHSLYRPSVIFDIKEQVLTKDAAQVRSTINANFEIPSAN